MATPEQFAAYVRHTPTAAARLAGIDRRTAHRFERRENGAGTFWLESRRQGRALARGRAVVSFAEAPSTDSPRCYYCWRPDHLEPAGDYWVMCRACGKRSTPSQIRKTIRLQKERQK